MIGVFVGGLAELTEPSFSRGCNSRCETAGSLMGATLCVAKIGESSGIALRSEPAVPPRRLFRLPRPHSAAGDLGSTLG